ncbi:MAG TPA: Minf_1886 family protein [Pirellulales bacterium]|jgi:uncharacterized repeat protein (TIGR04138 family)|nr:Minf_1886 family protein [Pirellulales bacterium]
MTETAAIISQLLRDDPRYKFDAYVLVFESLAYAHNVLEMGGAASGKPSSAGAPKAKSRSKRTPEEAAADEPDERHLTGQQLCEAIRLYALEQYGLMAKRVLNSLGVTKTGDFGDIVYNLIRIGQMRKTSQDRREDFDDVYDFDRGFDQAFQISMPKA